MYKNGLHHSYNILSIRVKIENYYACNLSEVGC